MRSSSKPTLLAPIKEEALNTFKEKFSTITRGLHTKMIGGGPMFPIPTEAEKQIIDLDNSAMMYKTRYKQRLQNVWNDTLQYTQSYKYNNNLNNRGSHLNLPESRNAGFRVGEPIVHDQLLEDQQ